MDDNTLKHCALGSQAPSLHTLKTFSTTPLGVLHYTYLIQMYLVSQTMNFLVFVSAIALLILQ